MRKVLIKLPLCNQHNTEHDPEWSYRICAICSLWMLLKFYDSNFSLSVMDLVKKGLALDGYLDNIGWKHATLVELARNFGLELQYAKNFFIRRKKKNPVF